MGDGRKAERWWDGEDARAAERTSVIIWSRVYVNGPRGLRSVMRGLKSDVTRWQTSMEGTQGARPAIAGPAFRANPAKSCRREQVQFRRGTIQSEPFLKNRECSWKRKCHLRRSSFIFLKLDHMRRYSAWLINVAALHNRISISSKFGGLRVRPCRWNSKSRLKMSKMQSSDPGSLKRFFFMKASGNVSCFIYTVIYIFDPTHYCLYFLCADVLSWYSQFIFLILFIFSCRTLRNIKTAFEINVFL